MDAGSGDPYAPSAAVFAAELNRWERKTRRLAARAAADDDDADADAGGTGGGGGGGRAGGRSLQSFHHRSHQFCTTQERGVSYSQSMNPLRSVLILVDLMAPRGASMGALW